MHFLCMHTCQLSQVLVTHQCMDTTLYMSDVFKICSLWLAVQLVFHHVSECIVSSLCVPDWVCFLCSEGAASHGLPSIIDLLKWLTWDRVVRKAYSEKAQGCWCVCQRFNSFSWVHYSHFILVFV
jgi:hypothetical protein